MREEVTEAITKALSSAESRPSAAPACKEPAELQQAKTPKALAAYYGLRIEGDLIWCPTCNTTGVNQRLLALKLHCGKNKSAKKRDWRTAFVHTNGREKTRNSVSGAAKSVHPQPPLPTATKFPISQFYVQSRNMSVEHAKSQKKAIFAP